jgi:hypothetical protein
MASEPQKKIGGRIVGPFQVMAMLLVGTYAALPLLPFDGSTPAVDLAIIGVLCATMLLGIRAAGRARSYFVAAKVLVGLIAAAAVAELFGYPNHDAARLVFALLTLIAIVTILSNVLSAHRVDADKIFAAICVLFLLGWFWSYIYVVVDNQTEGGAFTGLGDEHGESDDTGSLTYFSFVTLTTLGYGDIAPRTSFARVLATLQALMGQLYLAILVARLVALQIVHSRDEPSK